MTVGERIYYCRTENHMTQKELGEKTGIASATIGKYERGVLNPKISTLQKIAAALGVAWTDLCSADEAISALREEHNRLEIEANRLLDEAKTSYNETRKMSAQLALMTVEQLFGTDGRKLMEAYSRLNADGQSIAAERVEELAQIPKYQRTQESPQDTPAGPDNKTPAEK